MKKIKAESADTVTMKMVLRANLLRACVDSTIPIESPVSRMARGAANHQLKQQVAAMALAAIIAKQAVFNQPAI